MAVLYYGHLQPFLQGESQRPFILLAVLPSLHQSLLCSSTTSTLSSHFLFLLHPIDSTGFVIVPFISTLRLHQQLSTNIIEVF